MYRVVDASRVDGERMKLRLDRPSLLAEGLALGFEDGVVLNRVPMPFVTGGCELEVAAGTVPWRVAGTDHVGHKGIDVLVRNATGDLPSKSALANDFGGSSAFSVHAYGTGDSIEIGTHRLES